MCCQQLGGYELAAAAATCLVARMRRGRPDRVGRRALASSSGRDARAGPACHAPRGCLVLLVLCWVATGPGRLPIPYTAVVLCTLF